MQKFSIVLACAFVATSSFSQGRYYNNYNRLGRYEGSYYPNQITSQQSYPKYWPSYNPSPVAKPVAPIAPVVPVAPAVPAVLQQLQLPVAPVAPVAPATSSGIGMLSLMKLFSSSGFNMEALMQLIPEGRAALAKATDTLNRITPYLPTALANVPPTVKIDIAQVNGIIAEVCNKLVNEFRP